MKRSLRQLSVGRCRGCFWACHPPRARLSFAERVVNVRVFIMETAAGATKALFVVMVINKLVLQGAVILGPSDPYIRHVNRHLAFLLRSICRHEGVVLRTFHECIKSWMMRGVYSPLLWQQVVELELTWAGLAQPTSRHRPDSVAALA